MVYPDGKILFAAETKEEQPYNYLTFMEENSDLKDDQLDQIRRDMESGVEGMIQFRMTGREQYLSYQPVGFQDWVLLGIVPQQVGERQYESGAIGYGDSAYRGVSSDCGGRSRSGCAARTQKSQG